MIRSSRPLPSPCLLARDLPFKSFRWLMTPLLLWGFLCFVMLLGLSHLDLDFAFMVHGRGPAEWKDFMSRSLFEGHSFGASDLPTLLLIASLLLYAVGAPALRKRNPQLLVQLGFINLAGLWISIVVHMLKGASQRPRPYQTLEQGLPFHNFYDLSSWTFQGWGHGSFPSGHTASMMSLLVFAYLFRGEKTRRGAAFTVLAMAISMAFARTLVGAHWLSDTIGSIFLVMLCCDLLYRYILRVPEQLRWLAEGHVYPKNLTYWEIKLLPRLVLGIFIPFFPILIWTRFHSAFWVILCTLFSLLLFFFFIKDLGNYQLRQLQKLKGTPRP